MSDKEKVLKETEAELLKGKAHLDSIKTHYLSELGKLNNKKEELEKYHESIIRLRGFVKEMKEREIKAIR